MKASPPKCLSLRRAAWPVVGLLLSAAPHARAEPGPAAQAAKAPAASAKEDWPASTDRLVFLWQDRSRPNRIPSAGAEAQLVCRVRARGRAKFDRFHDMSLARGAFLAEGVDDLLLAACRASGEVTVEAVITPLGLKQSGPARIITFSQGASSRNFTLGQDGDKLVLRLRTPSNGTDGTNAEPVLCRLTAGKPHHVIVTYADGTTTCYLNGRRASVSRAVQGDFRNWQPQHLLFGDEWDGGADWAGRLEGIAIYSRAVGADEAGRKHALYARRLAARKPARRVVLMGRLAEITPTPTVQSIHPYRRCLAVYTYQVEKVLAGEYGEKKILVAHWAILDAKVLDLQRKKDRTYRLTVEPFADHPQLDAERRVMVQDEFGLETYYDVEE